MKKRDEVYIKECLAKDPEITDKRLVMNVWFAKIRDHAPNKLDEAYEFMKLLKDGVVSMPQAILDKRDELLIDVKNW